MTENGIQERKKNAEEMIVNLNEFDGIEKYVLYGYMLGLDTGRKLNSKEMEQRGA